MTCPTCGVEIPEAVMPLHRRVCAADAPPARATTTTDSEWFEEAIAIRDQAVEAMKVRLSIMTEKLDHALGARDRAEREATQARRAKEMAERTVEALAGRHTDLQARFTSLQSQFNTVEEALKRERRKNRDEDGHTFPIPEDARRELAKLMVQKPGRGYERD